VLGTNNYIDEADLVRTHTRERSLPFSYMNVPNPTPKHETRHPNQIPETRDLKT
jgi:hypothetical protein